MRERRGEIEIALLHAGAAQRHQHADLDAVLVEMLAPHQVEVAAGGPLLGKRVRAHAGGHHARIGELAGEAMAHMLAEGLHVVAPARGEEGMQVARCAQCRMDVAVDDREPRGGSPLANRYIHRTVSLRPALSPISLSSRKRR